jgi:translation initiation factor 3 subunit C
LAVTAVHRFLVGSDSSDSDDDKRVVRSAKDRRFEELNATCAELRVCWPPALGAHGFMLYA